MSGMPAEPDGGGWRLAPDDRPILRTGAGELSRAALLRRAHALAERLPDGPAALNLCERRETYLAALLALEIRGQACLMPPSRAAGVLDEVAAAHPGSFRITDAMVDDAADAAANVEPRALELDPARVIAIGYTSGSTGRPQANRKTWRSLVEPARHNAARLRRELPEFAGRQPWLVATVPSQHMYGMECAAVLPLFTGMGVHSSHPLFPADVAASLADVPEPRVLVSTPVHLRALLEADVALPPLAAVVSATAPLAAELAAQVEQRFSTRVVEFFGSTETCVIASRRPARGEPWRLHEGVQCTPAGDGTSVEAPWFDGPLPMQDMFEFEADGRFRVVGRCADMIEVAGKRASLADLTRRLLAVPGVRDAAIVQPGDVGSMPVRRLVAFVVGDADTPQVVAAALAAQVDPVFIPRPIVRVGRLPRNDVGKLPRERLLALVREHALDGAGR